MAIKHPIRDILLFWLGERMWRRHEQKKLARRARAGRAYPESKTRKF
jgi:hypothetical protein